jgi:RNA polymerase sigma-70 factor (ECF subfamily)
MVESDEEKIWVTRSQNGDHAAFESLIRTHQTMIHSLTFRMTGSVADSRDLAQETFVRAFQQLASYHGTARFSSWLYRIAINACLDWRRSEKRRLALHTNWSQHRVDNHSPAEAAVDLDDLSRDVQAALMKLPEKQRAAIALTVYGGKNHAEAANILGCSETTVSWRIFSAHRKLKKILSTKISRNEGGPRD